MPDQVPKAVVRERYDRLIACLEEITWAENRRLLGKTVEVLVAVGEGRKDDRTGRLSGRARDGRLVHFAAGGFAGRIRPGDIVETVIDYAAPHHLNADAEPVAHRRTRAGDAYEAGRSPRTGGVLLGLPTVGAPPTVPIAASACDR